MSREEDQLINEILDFLDKRRTADSRQNAIELLTYLSEKRKEGAGWVQTKELLTHFVPKIFKYEATFFRILVDLRKRKIIIPKKVANPSGKGRKIVYYRVPVVYSHIWMMDRSTFTKELEKIARRYGELEIAKILLSRLGIEDPDAAIREELIKKWGDPENIYITPVQDDDS